jgi:hypothetical protein
MSCHVLVAVQAGFSPLTSAVEIGSNLTEGTPRLHTAFHSAVRLLLWWLSGARPSSQQVRGDHRIV